MSYKSKTIKAVIDEIDQNKFYLPALQRKFVWRKHQIELLFDSLMRNYPIGTFLFWHLHREKAEHYVFYEFLKEYDERNPYNRRKTGAFSQPEIMGVLDGQQRLSSMYVGLMGTHTEKAPYRRSTNPDAYEKTELYLNLLSLPYVIDENDEIRLQEDINFEFCFLTGNKAESSVMRKSVSEDGAEPQDEPMFWMKAGQVLSWRDDPEFDQLIKGFYEQCTHDVQREAILGKKRLIRRGLSTLYDRIRKEALINYFEVAKDDLEDILKIFVRVNSGATILSKTDLLFSTIVATWNDGREQIENLLKEINGKGDGFNFGNEYLMRCCLVLSDGPVVFKVNSFKSENVQKIRDEWSRIAEAVKKTVDLLVEFGFSGSVLTSEISTIIIAYYIRKGGVLDRESKKGIQRYLIHALLNGIYNSSQDALITALRHGVRKEVTTPAGVKTYCWCSDQFSFDEMLKIALPQQKSLAVTEADIERFLQITKGPSSFFVLSLLYPHLRFNEVVFHQDHMHPEAGFSKANFEEMRLPPEQRQEWLDCRDCVPNLQLMKDRQNESKNATPLKTWMENMEESERVAFFKDNYFPANESLEFSKFMQFFKLRKEILRNELRKVLALTNVQAAVVIPEWSDQTEESEA
ncbi:MAG: DUF262 domain-containing protein [Rugosibacter sp.]|nr:DUF262 domain-containing protein [Rugosibacter sp.]